jgi:hypothetical protein
MLAVIEFYVPAGFQPARKPWVPPALRGKIIAFPDGKISKSA